MNLLSSGVGIRSAARWASLIASRSTVATLRPVSAEEVITGGRSRSFCVARARASSMSVREMSHLFMARTVAQPDRMATSATRRSSAVSPSLASQTTMAASARSAARSERSCA
jgi:hypothetical protein